MAKTFSTPPSLLLGIDLIKNSWLAWQVNSSTYRWGAHIDELIRQNGLRGHKGKPLYHHDIAVALGLKDNGTPGAGVNFKDIPIIDADEWEDGLINSVKNKDNKVVVNVPLTTKKYRNPADLLTEYKQRGRAQPQVIKTTGDLLNPFNSVIKDESSSTTNIDLDETGEVYKKAPITFKIE